MGRHRTRRKPVERRGLQKGDVCPGLPGTSTEKVSRTDRSGPARRLRTGRTAMKKESRPALGLDIGTSRVVTARHAEEGFRYESQLNAFVTVPFSKLTEGVLDKAGIAH